MQTIICSHGFGVRADARGLFTELNQAFPNDTFVMFDYNSTDSEGNTVVPSLDEQAAKLQAVIDTSPAESVLLCHSQGSIIAGLVNIEKVSQVILLAPPVKLSMERVIEKMAHKPGSIINSDGSSKLPRSDGTMTFVPPGYVERVMSIDPISLYARFADQKPTTIIRSLQDEVVGLTDVDKVRSAKIIDLNADHNFTGTSRGELTTALSSILRS